jgi:hypothetical protein
LSKTEEKKEMAGGRDFRATISLFFLAEKGDQTIIRTGSTKNGE